MIKTNYHTHTTFCDGKNTAREMVEAAIEKNFDILGFSGHSMFPYSSDWHIQSREHQAYINEINSLKDKFKNKIKIYAGFEADYILGFCTPSFKNYKDFSPDYLIGSVHFVPGKGGMLEADSSQQSFAENVKNYFGGNVKKAVQEYFYLEREMIQNSDFTILGHPDLISCQNTKDLKAFDDSSSWYKKELKLTAKKISSWGGCIELNTGGIFRKGLSTPYPSPYFLSLLKELNVPVMINSDAHTTSGLDAWFDEAVQYIKKAGYTELSFYEDGSIKSQKI